MSSGRPTVAVLGGTGQLGTALGEELRRRSVEVEAPPRTVLDLTAQPAVLAWLAATRASVVINAAAYTDVAGAEAPGAQAEVWRLNRDLPADLARGCARRGARLVHVSTDFVFDGQASAPYGEADAPGPLQVYGASKLAGEREVLEACPGALVVRTSTLFGRAARARRNYVDAVLQQAREGRRVLDLVRIPVGSPTHAADLAGAIADLLERDAAGVIHVVNRGAVSRFDLARAALALAGYAAVELRERPEPAEGPRRPAYSALDPSWCESSIGRSLRDWSAALEGYVLGAAQSAE
jgi:dTDP-4-dehydrorhamnose reductase